MKMTFCVTVPDDLSAGLRGFTETVVIEFQDTIPPDADYLADCQDHFRKAIADWFDTSERLVETEAERNTREKRYE